MIKKQILAFTIGLVALGLVSCAGNSPQTGSEPTATTAQITPYQTATQSVSTLAVTEVPTPTQPPLPSPTPFMYTVVANDTMIGIASRFGITYDELQVANPEVNPNILSVGTQLVIPVEFEDEDQANDQLLPIEEGEIECFQIRSGGVRCYWVVINTLDTTVENITAVIRLYDSRGQQLTSKQAVPFLNILEPGLQAPLTAFFEAPTPDWQLAQGQIQSVVAANEYEERYILGNFEGVETTISQDGLQADISGSLQLSSEGQPEYIWILAVAYDSDGAVVGTRRWEAQQDQLIDRPYFDFQVFSLGRPIDQVELLFEARTLPAEESGS